jgi:tetratricopeptide (TPR) repeat protein
VLVPRAEDAGVDGAPPPDVPLLLDLEDVVERTGSEPGADALVVPAGQEALPTELQALLNGSETESVVVPTETGADHDQAMADDAAEAEFYLSQGMTDEARAVHHRMQVRDPQHPAVATLAEQIDRASAAPTPDTSAAAVTIEPPAPAEPSSMPSVAPIVSEAPPKEMVPQFTVTSEPPVKAQTEFVNLGAELDQELNGGELTTTEPVTGPLVDGLLKELQKGVREHLDEKDYETHYNLGIAYKEMELYDEAIQEFRLTAREPKRALECADLVGLCFLAKGQPEQAVQDLQAGLAIEGHPPEAYHNLRYDLGTALEAAGDLPGALGQFEVLQSEGARFLDLQTRLDTIRARLPRTPVPTPKEVPPRRKKKISFI